MGYSHLCQMEIQNIFNLKGYHNLKNSGQSLIIDFISNLFGCEVHLYHVPIKQFEELYGIDITSNIFRSCYTIDDNTRVIKIKVYDEKETLETQIEMNLEFNKKDKIKLNKKIKLFI